MKDGSSIALMAADVLQSPTHIHNKVRNDFRECKKRGEQQAHAER